MATKHTFTVEVVFNDGTPPTFGTGHVADILLGAIEGDNLIELEADGVSIRHSVDRCDPVVVDGEDETASRTMARLPDGSICEWDERLRTVGAVEIEVEGGGPMFVNRYECPACEHEWQDTWSATCDDDCPNCGKR